MENDLLAIVICVVFFAILLVVGIRFFKAKRPIIGTTLIYIGISPLALGLLCKFGIIKDTNSVFFAMLAIITAWSLTIPNFLPSIESTK